MRPEISLVLLTTLSGVGQGLFIFVTILYITTYFGVQVPMELLVLLTSISLIFPGLGGLASFFHLGHPARGWKAIKKWKHSWLSREVILLALFVGLVALFLLGLLLEFSFLQLALIAIFASTTSLALYLASAFGVAYETYNSHEFHQPMNSEENSVKKTIVLLICFIIPLIIWVFIGQGYLPSRTEYYALGAAISMSRGLFLERKLFFAQGNHVQNLYYGNFRSPDVVNPLVVSGRK